MKRLFALFLCLVLALSLIPAAAAVDIETMENETAQDLMIPAKPGGPSVKAEDVAIDATNFPDSAFRSHVASFFDTDYNDVLTPSEIAAVTEIDCMEKGITSLKGIEYFTSLKKLDCSENKLTTLNLNACKQLKELDCSENKLTALNLNACTELEELDCSDNRLSVLDLYGKTKLEEADCHSNKLTALNLTRTIALEELDCHDNQLTALDLAWNWELIELSCYLNDISALNINHCPDLLAAVYVGNMETQRDDGFSYDYYYIDWDWQYGNLSVDSTTAIRNEESGTAPIITAQPSDQSGKLGDTVTLSLEASGDGLFYRWFYIVPDAEEGYIHQKGMLGVDASYLNFTIEPWYLQTECDFDTTYNDNHVYIFCEVWDQYGNRTISQRCRVLILPLITTQPKSVTANEGETVKFTVASKGVDMRYQWQYNNGSGWKDSGMTGNKSATLSVPATAARNGQKYRCVIKCYRGVGEPVTSSAATLTVKLPAPTLTVKLNAKGQPYLTWTAVSTAAKYEIWRSTSSGGTYTKLSTTTGRELTNSSAAAGTTYYYKVRAVDANGNAGAYSAVKSAKASLAAPTLTVKLNSKGQPYLTWTAVTGAAKYEIWRATSADGTYTKLSTTTGKSLTNSSATAGTTYFYKVRAIASDGAAGVFSAVKSAKASTAAPTLTVKLNAKGQPYLTWTAVTGAAKYEIWRATSESGTYTKLSTTTGKSLTNSSVTVGTTYYYKVRAMTSDGAAGQFSAVKSIRARLAAPTLTVKLNAKGQPYLTWTAVTGAAKYEIWRATSADGTYTKLSTTTGKSLTNSSASSGVTYYYKVRAVGADGYVGVFSTVKSATAK